MSNRTAFLLPVAFGLVALCACNDYRARNEANPYYIKGEAARQDGRYLDAIAFYQECLHFSPDSDKAHLQLGILFEEEEKDYARAIVHYREAVRLNGGNPDVDRLLEQAERHYYFQLQNRFAPPRPREETSLPVPTAIPVETAALPPSTPAPTPAALPPETRPATPEQTTAQSPSAPAPAPLAPNPSPAPRRSYTVQDGDNLSKISNKVYGSSRHWEVIYAANRQLLPTPERLRPGQELTIPELKK